MEGDKSDEKIFFQERKIYDDQFFSIGEIEFFGEDFGRKCNCLLFLKRYIIFILVLFGFCNVYVLRVNFSVVLVVMVVKSWIYKEGRKVEVSLSDLQYIYMN